MLPELRDDYHARFQEFKEQYCVHSVVGICGGAQARIDGLPKDHPIAVKYAANLNERIRKIIVDCLEQLRGHNIAIMTGGTNEGVPQIAADEAKAKSLKLIFVSPHRGRAYRPNIEPDLDFSVGSPVGESQWGDESALFAHLLDGALVIGGGTGTLVECAHILKINESIIGSPGKKTKYIVPLHGFSGVSELLSYLCFRDQVRSASIPSKAIYGGEEAGKLLLHHLRDAG